MRHKSPSIPGERGSQGPPRYAVFFYDVRRDLDLSANEYLLADLVHNLSGDKSRYPGWCYASRGHLARMIGLSERAIQAILRRLEAKGLIERHPHQVALLRTSSTWQEEVARVKRRQRVPRPR